MKVLVCQVCSNRNFAKQGDMYVCQSCGTQYTVEDARKLLVDVPDAPAAPNYAQQNYAQPNYAQPNYAQTPNNADEINRYRILARRAAEAHDVDNALKYYEHIYTLAPNDWEAAFHSIYYRAYFGRYTEIGRNTDNVSNSLPGIMNLIATYVPPAERPGIVRYMAGKIENLAHECNIAVDHYQQTHDNSYSTCETMRDAIRDMAKMMAGYAERDYNDKATAVHLLQSVAKDDSGCVNVALNEEIRRLDPSLAAENDKAIAITEKKGKAMDLTGWGIVALIFGIPGILLGLLLNKLFDIGTVVIALGAILTVLGVVLTIVGKVKGAKAK